MAVRPGDALNIVKYEISLKQPSRITATNLRKHTATISQVMGLEDQQLRWLVNHMGHTEKVHLQNYRATSGLIERLDIAKIMLLQEKNAHGRFADVKLCDIQFEDFYDNDGPVDVDRGSASAELVVDGADSEAASTSVAGNAGSDSDDAEYENTNRKLSKRAVKRIPWTKNEVIEINKYFKHFVTLQSKRKCPGMRDCMLAINHSKTAGGEIWKRPWETIKKKVSNLMKARSKTMNSE